jgi:hypothetical protein
MANSTICGVLLIKMAKSFEMIGEQQLLALWLILLTIQVRFLFRNLLEHSAQTKMAPKGATIH